MSKLKLEKTRNYQYTNVLHLQFFIALLNLIKKFGANMLKIGDLFDRICRSVEKEESSHKVIRKSDISNLKAESDHVRDDIVVGIKKILESALHHFDVNVREASYRLKIVFDAYNKPTPLIHLGYDAETASINKLLQEWENKYMSDLETVGLVTWVKELHERNNAFDELTRRYSEQLAEKPALRPKEARRETDELYKEILLVIGADIALENKNAEESIYAPFVNELNVLIKHYNDLLAQHLGRIEAEKKREKEQKEKGTR
jgi:hypothetical protein